MQWVLFFAKYANPISPAKNNQSIGMVRTMAIMIRGSRDF